MELALPRGRPAAQVIDVLVSTGRDGTAARQYFTRASRRALAGQGRHDRAPVYPLVIEEFVLEAAQVTEPNANNRVETVHGRFEARLRPMRRLKRLECEADRQGSTDLLRRVPRARHPLRERIVTWAVVGVAALPRRPERRAAHPPCLGAGAGRAVDHGLALLTPVSRRRAHPRRRTRPGFRTWCGGGSQIGKWQVRSVHTAPG